VQIVVLSSPDDADQHIRFLRRREEEERGRARNSFSFARQIARQMRGKGRWSEVPPFPKAFETRTMSMERAEREIMAARHLFVEMLLRDLMVSECLRAEAPLREVSRRTENGLAAADGLLARNADHLSSLMLEHTEMFWKQVQEEVIARLDDANRKRG